MPKNHQKNDEYPERGEYVIGTVREIFRQGAFITLDEYADKRGMLHLSEISLKWVRNIRDYVREGQKVVLVVLNANPERGHIDLSLRRVTDARRKEKLQQVKKLQRAEKLFDIFADEQKISKEEVESKLKNKILKVYQSLYDGLEAIASDEEATEKLNLPAELKTQFIELVRKNIKPPFVYVTGYAELKSYESDGINVIKESLKKIRDYKESKEEPEYTIEVSYISPPIYRIKVESKNYKSAEKALKNAAEEGIKYMRKHGSIGEFYRQEAEIKKEK